MSSLYLFGIKGKGLITPDYSLTRVNPFHSYYSARAGKERESGKKVQKISCRRNMRSKQERLGGGGGGGGGK